MAPSALQGMEPVLNPLYDGNSMKSPVRAVPKAQQEQQQQAPGRCAQCRTSCFRGTPWFMVLAVAALAAAIITWSIFTERFMVSALQLLDKLNVQPPGGLSHVLMILKAVLVGVTSFLGAMLLLLAVVHKRQQLAKRAATTRADWPQGCKSHATMGLAVSLAVLLWLAAAGFVILMCCTFSATGVALVAELAAGQALTFADSRPPLADSPRVQQLQSTIRNTRSAFTAAVNKAPPIITRQPWFKGLTESMNPLLARDTASTPEEAPQEDLCPANCLDLQAVTSFLQKRNATAAGCICIRTHVEDAKQLLGRMWRDGVGAFASTAALAVTVTWLLVYCVVTCVTTWRDNEEAKHCKYLLQQDNGQDGNISRWMWTAGIASPNSASETMSSFPAFEPPSDAKRPPQLLAPEFTASTMSPSPKKQAKWGTGAGQDDQHVHRAAVDQQASDIERPAQLPLDQLPVVPTAQPPAGSAAPSSTQLSNGRGPASQPTAAGIGYADSGSNGGRPDVAARAPPSSSTSSYRRRWQDSIGSKR